MSRLLLALALASEPRVIVVSFDAAGYVLTSRFLAEGKLPSFERLIREGAWSDGMVSSFPTKTAVAHALLFTGQHGHRSGITANSVLKLPSSSGSRLETLNGFFSDSLRVEPVWSMAARAGLETYVFHAPQVYPFRPEPRLYVAHGYTEAQSEGEALDPQVVIQDTSNPREIRFTVGESTFRGSLFDDPDDPKEGCDTLGVAPEWEYPVFAARIKPGDGERFSEPIPARLSGREAWFSLRLFELRADCSSFVLYRSGAFELALSPSELPDFGLRAYSGNGGTGAYSQGGFGPTIPSGGSGEAEKRLLETEYDLQTQLIEQARWALSRNYRLVVLYSPVIDDVAHELFGYVAEHLDGYDEPLARRIWPFIEEAFLVQDRYLKLILEAADRDGSHVLVVSDHGMSGTDKLVHLNIALEKAGLLGLGADRSIHLSRTRALAPPLGDASIAVNAVDRPGGIVPLEEKPFVLEEVRRALEALTAPGSGERVVTAFYEPSTTGLLQPGGASTGDLFLDFAPGFYPSTATTSDVVVEKMEPSGEHIFVPTRREMLAIFGAYGPRIPKGINLGRVQGIDVAPTILDLLGIEPRLELPGRSLVPDRGILN